MVDDVAVRENEAVGREDDARPGAALKGAFYNKRTRWPKGIDPVAEGAVLREYG